MPRKLILRNFQSWVEQQLLGWRRRRRLEQLVVGMIAARGLPPAQAASAADLSSP